MVRLHRHLHDTYLNGTEVGAERLAPGWTDYNDRLQYRAYDVTGTRAHRRCRHRRYGTSPWYSAPLSTEYTDGTRPPRATDTITLAGTGAPGFVMGFRRGSVQPDNSLPRLL